MTPNKGYGFPILEDIMAKFEDSLDLLVELVFTNPHAGQIDTPTIIGSFIAIGIPETRFRMSLNRLTQKNLEAKKSEGNPNV
jgi:hypothetical protein